MYAPRVFVYMTGVLIVSAVSAYLISGSVLAAFLYTLICAVILQVGYFVGVLYLVSREKKQRSAILPPRPSVMSRRDSSARDALRPDAAANLPTRDA